MRKTRAIEGRHYALLNADGHPVGDWWVMNAYQMPDGRRRVTLVNAKDPGDTLELYAEELGDPARFRAHPDPAAPSGHESDSGVVA